MYSLCNHRWFWGFRSHFIFIDHCWATWLSLSTTAHPWAHSVSDEWFAIFLFNPKASSCFNPSAKESTTRVTFSWSCHNHYHQLQASRRPAFHNMVQWDVSVVWRILLGWGYLICRNHLGRDQDYFGNVAYKYYDMGWSSYSVSLGYYWILELCSIIPRRLHIIVDPTQS